MFLFLQTLLIPDFAPGQISPPDADSTPAVGTISFAPSPPKRVVLALSETIGINLFVNVINRVFSSEPDVFRVTPETWADNLQEGWEWDDNQFRTNQIEHPYHGSAYFNAGRSNGLDFWESASMAMVGSLTWEYFGETTRPSINDFINTTAGGIALGEMFHRAANLVRDNRAAGSERFWREVGGFAIDPVGGFNRVIRGESGRSGPNPRLHHVPNARTMLRIGILKREDQPNGVSELDTGGYAEFRMIYGDPLESVLRKPYDVFRLRVEGGVADTARINRFQGEGMLAATRLRWGRSVVHRFMLQQRFDYVTNNAYEFGGQSVEARVLSRFAISKRHRLTTAVGVLGTLLGAISSEQVGLPRDYDFGPGLGLQLGVQWDRGGLTYARWEYLNWVIPTLAGSDATHVVHIGGLEGQVHVWRDMTVGAAASYFRRDSYHPGDVSFHQDTPEFRIFLGWTP